MFPVFNEPWEAESNRQIDILNSKAVVNLEGIGDAIALDIVPSMVLTH